MLKNFLSKLQKQNEDDIEAKEGLVAQDEEGTLENIDEDDEEIVDSVLSLREEEEEEEKGEGERSSYSSSHLHPHILILMYHGNLSFSFLSFFLFHLLKNPSSLQVGEAEARGRSPYRQNKLGTGSGPSLVFKSKREKEEAEEGGGGVGVREGDTQENTGTGSGDSIKSVRVGARRRKRRDGEKEEEKQLYSKIGMCGHFFFLVFCTFHLSFPPLLSAAACPSFLVFPFLLPSSFFPPSSSSTCSLLAFSAFLHYATFFPFLGSFLSLLSKSNGFCFSFGISKSHRSLPSPLPSCSLCSFSLWDFDTDMLKHITILVTCQLPSSTRLLCHFPALHLQPLHLLIFSSLFFLTFFFFSLFLFLFLFFSSSVSVLVPLSSAPSWVGRLAAAIQLHLFAATLSFLIVPRSLLYTSILFFGSIYSIFFSYGADEIATMGAISRAFPLVFFTVGALYFVAPRFNLRDRMDLTSFELRAFISRYPFPPSIPSPSPSHLVFQFVLVLCHLLLPYLPS
jgi:hypothetical protein